MPVAPGRYVVEARDGPVSASTTVTVIDNGPTVAEVVLNAGILRVRTQAQKTGAPLGDAVVTISEAAQGEGRKDASIGQPLVAFKGSDGVAILPAGRYLVRVEQGLVRADRSVVVPVGSQGVIDVPLNAARLQLSAVGKEIAESGRSWSSALPRTTRTHRAAGARWRDRRRDRLTSCWRREPTT